MAKAIVAILALSRKKYSRNSY